MYARMSAVWMSPKMSEKLTAAGWNPTPSTPFVNVRCVWTRW